MRIGILTFYESDNYGTVLQAYGLQNYLKKVGYSTELINLARDTNTQSSYFHYKNVRKYSNLQRLWNKFILFRHRSDSDMKKKNFKMFREQYLKISAKYYASGKEILKDLDRYDFFISGGDQIWNPYHKIFSFDYMCRFLPGNFRRISYGSSFGVDTIYEDKYIQQMKECLSAYSSILVRENSGVNIIRQMGLNASQVVDPVFLDMNSWYEFVEEQSPEKSKYGLIYALVDYPTSDDELIRQFAAKEKMKLVILPENRRNCLNFYKKLFSLSPQSFINYVAHSEVVFTNSFHGLAFAVIFRKKVVLLNTCTKEAEKKQVRLNDLLNFYEAKNYNLDCICKEFYFNYKKLEESVASSKIY